MSNRLCSYIHELTNVPAPLDKYSTLCTFGMTSKHSLVCGFASFGNALISNNTLVGLLAWTKCDWSSLPVYTRISGHNQWIQKALTV